MRISVILPTKDRGPDIDQTLAALRDQSVAVADYEVIVVDNASLRPHWTPGNTQYHYLA